MLKRTGHCVTDLEIELKQCAKCKQVLALENFSWGLNFGIRKQRHECKVCEKHLHKIRSKLRKEIPPPGPEFCCPICLKNEEQLHGIGGQGRSVWCVDHNHETDKFNGWLCHKCNRTLGGFYDDLDILERAVEYVKKVNRKSKIRLTLS